MALTGYGIFARIYRKVRREMVGNERWARENGATIGEGCRILSNVVTSEPWLVSVGDRTTISTEVLLVTHDGTGWLHDDEQGRRYYIGPVSIGSQCFIGARSIILPNVRIGDRVIVGAGSVVSRSVPDGTVVAGNPARVVGTYDDFMARSREWPSDAQRSGATLRDRVDSVVQGALRPEMGQH